MELQGLQEANRWDPAVALAWKLNEEDFLKKNVFCD
jgi:hypothetical protein